MVEAKTTAQDHPKRSTVVTFELRVASKSSILFIERACSYNLMRHGLFY